MDSQKTGAVIAGRRTELGMTQKQLAERLHISDRTVSRWERGVGFPDLSLLEPLADALELSVLELLRGERVSPAEPPAPEPEHSVREVFRAQTLRLKRFKGLLVVLAVLLAAAGAALVWLIASPDRAHVVSQQTITAAQAAAICPDVLITTGEYELLAELLEADGVRSAFSDDASAVLPDAFSAPYRERVQAGGEPPGYFRIEILRHTLYVEYGTEFSRRTLTVSALTGQVMKCAAQYGTEETWLSDVEDPEAAVSLGRDPDYIVINYDNMEFSQAVATLDILASLQAP